MRSGCLLVAAVAIGVLLHALTGSRVLHLFRREWWTSHHGRPPFSEPKAEQIPEWMVRSGLRFNDAAWRVLPALTPSVTTVLHVTFASRSLVDFVNTWSGHARRAGLWPLIVGAVDEEMLSICDGRFSLPSIADTAANISLHAAIDNLRRPYFRNVPHAFRELGRLKLALLLALLAPGFSVLMSDVDVVWLGRDWSAWMLLPAPRDTTNLTATTPSDATPPLAEAVLLHHADVLVSTDALDASMDFADLSRGPGDEGWLGFGMHSELNTGILFFRGGAIGALALARAWRWRLERASLAGETSHDQLLFAQVVRSAAVASVSKNVAVWRAWDARPSPVAHGISATARDVFHGIVRAEEKEGAPPAAFTIGTLPASQFVSGHWWFAQAAWMDARSPTQQPSPMHPQALHLTFGFADRTDYPHGKRQRAREAGLWLADGDGYYGHGLAELPEEPAELFITLVDGVGFTEEERRAIDALHPEWAPERHLALVALQLITLRQLLMLAHALNATVIMPPLVCACDRHWGLLRACRAPDASPRMRLPFRCPMDHLFEVGEWQAGVAPVRFREHGFLSDPRLAPSVRRGAVRIFARPDAGDAAPGSAESGFAIGLPHGLSMSRVLPRLRAANPNVRLAEIGLQDLRGLCPRLGTRAESFAFDARARDLLVGRGAASVAYCASERNAAFPGWSAWDGEHPPLNCSHAPLTLRAQLAPRGEADPFDAACSARIR